MTKRINHVAPLQLGIVLAALYGAISLLIVPFLILASVLAPSGTKGLPIVFIIVFPVLYAIAGFLGGIIAAAIYNLIAKWTGGIELTLEDPP
jgi:hypothetical protein